jgi:hypothetical protein
VPAFFQEQVFDMEIKRQIFEATLAKIFKDHQSKVHEITRNVRTIFWKGQYLSQSYTIPFVVTMINGDRYAFQLTPSCSLEGVVTVKDPALFLQELAHPFDHECRPISRKFRSRTKDTDGATHRRRLQPTHS